MPKTEPKIGDNRGNAGKGRPKGAPNKTTAALKEAIILAAESVGEDGNGKGRLTGYCTRLALTQPVAFAGLLGKVLPLQVAGTGDNGAIEINVTVGGNAGQS